MMKRGVLAMAVAMSLVLGACEAENLPVRQVALHGPQGQVVPVTAEAAVTDAQREHGLMDRKSMAENAGMLFVWPVAAPVKFWMKNTYIPLDMLFFNKGKLVGVVAWARPLDETPVGPDAPVDAVLEVNGGFAAAHGIAGDYSGWSFSER